MPLIKSLFAGLTFVLVLGFSIDAFANGLQCKEIRDADIGARKAKVKQKCTQQKCWDRRRCEHEIVIRADACETPSYENMYAATNIHGQVYGFRRVDFGLPKELKGYATGVRGLIISASKGEIFRR